ncbi:subunit of TIM23 translocase complex [Ascosphaera atra]|nr:subunit of TIM23 translocase complex [Ascosphaera atra]
MPVVQGGMQGPSTFDKLKMGAMMGGTVGAIMGFIMGTVTIFNYGAGPSGVMRTLGKYVVGSGTTFGFFMSIGSVIRNEGPANSYQMWSHVRHQPFITPRQYTQRPLPQRQ